MATKKPAKSQGASTVAARRNRELERQTEAAEARADLIAETRKNQRDTAKRLADKPTDTRKLVS